MPMIHDGSAPKKHGDQTRHKRSRRGVENHQTRRQKPKRAISRSPHHPQKEAIPARKRTRPEPSNEEYTNTNTDTNPTPLRRGTGTGWDTGWSGRKRKNKENERKRRQDEEGRRMKQTFFNSKKQACQWTKKSAAENRVGKRVPSVPPHATKKPARNEIKASRTKDGLVSNQSVIYIKKKKKKERKREEDEVKKDQASTQAEWAFNETKTKRNNSHRRESYCGDMHKNARTCQGPT
ncbi:hypothetical protein C8R45DRAFT_938007 [Mycena sanguinolenta]|nr:hypothetical protein C8R45DRAFT_938007 [Mycena sanguinolenta]